MFDIANFRSIVMRDDVLRNNRFRVRVPFPLGMFRPNMGEDRRIAQELEMWCEAASIPTIGIQTNKVYRYGVGVPESRPYSKIFTDVNVTYIADGYNEKWKFFENWTNLIFNTNMEGGINEVSDLAGAGFGGFQGTNAGYMPMLPYELAYRDEYISDVIIDVFRPTGECVTSVTLRDAFPVAVSGLDFNWKDNDSYAKLQITFAYTDIYRNRILN